MSLKADHRQETIIYLVMWALMFAAPVMTLSIRIANTGEDFEWNEVLRVWREYIPFFVIFLIHNHMLAPMLVYDRKRLLYVSISIALMVIFEIYQCNHRPMIEHRGPHAEMMHGQRLGERPPLPPDDFFDDHMPKEEHRPPIMMEQHDVIAIVILILMLGMNIGIKLYFKQQGDRKKMDYLEKQNLEQQLEYLKYQINPHFFMNTLNNIHALVDIDPEKAKATILELSKMMRFVLYEGNKAGVPLNREVEFLKNYITLMKLRYTEKVSISMKTPGAIPANEVPPLMLITFVENAFKHGVSYRQESFIDIDLTIEESRMQFVCRNSRIPQEDDKHGGVGLANVRKRLDLIYGDKYSLGISDEPETYTIKLTIPL